MALEIITVFLEIWRLFKALTSNKIKPLRLLSPPPSLLPHTLQSGVEKSNKILDALRVEWRCGLLRTVNEGQFSVLWKRWWRWTG
jgi:hypothetical protein